ncbi:hypothetical protein CLV68_3303 [Actinokineospora cianjurensis]|uniref:Uncharacterized protein n=1 Tax=Actinokineospora cianjurensis TaxID=585224 RepID=A0A421B3C1_9PSEU|nr:hypothetical protein CLV68_3303 [Actinokineospora cianjurensis]
MTNTASTTATGITAAAPSAATATLGDTPWGG